MYQVEPETVWARWRPLVDVVGRWDPKEHDQTLQNKQTYHARTAYEYSMLLDLCKEDENRHWNVTPVLQHFRLLALLELRAVEVQLASHQLGAHCLGIRTSDRDAVYAAATFAFRTQLLLHDLLCKVGNVRKGRGEVLGERPSRTSTGKQLAKDLDRQLHAVTLFCQGGGADMILKAVPYTVSQEELERLVGLMGLLVKSMDRVMAVTE